MPPRKIPTAPYPGAIGFAHGKGIIPWAIRLGERLRFRSGDFWSHAFIVAGDGPDPLIIQAEAHGVTDDKPLSTVAPGGSYEIVPLPKGCDPAKVLEFARSQVGQQYGWLSIASVVVHILTPAWLPIPSLRTARTWICSAIAGEALRYGGWLHDWADIYEEVPSELYAAILGISVRDVVRYYPRLVTKERVKRTP